MGETGRATVLVVEDEAPLVEIYARWLEGEYRVRTAQSGEVALERLDGSVDVVLLDRLMPGMSGDEVLETIGERGLNPRVAMVTAVEPDFDIVRMGFDDYLTKPIDRKELLATVERLLARASFADLEREYYALIEKQAALQSAKSTEELERNEEYAELRARVEALSEELDSVMPELDDGDFVAMVRDIEARSVDTDSDTDSGDADAGGGGGSGSRSEDGTAEDGRRGDGGGADGS
jgi:DNA-binding response OmpR family regulator